MYAIRSYYGADVLIEELMAKYDDKIEKEVEKARKKFGDSFDETVFKETNQRVLENVAKRNEIHNRFVKA